MAHTVFISYSGKDKPAADSVCAALEAGGTACWIAPRDIRPGASFGAEIVQALKEAKVFVLIFSGAANASPHVSTEVRQAFDQGASIITFRVEDIPPTGDLSYFLSNMQWIEAYDAPIQEYIPVLTGAIDQIVSLDETAEKPEPSASAAAAAPPEAQVQKPPQKKPRTGKLIPVLIGLILLAGAGIAGFLFSVNGNNGGTRKNIALEKRAAADKAGGLVTSAQVQTINDAYRLWREAEDSRRQGGLLFEENKYPEAEAQWSAAVDQYARALQSRSVVLRESVSPGTPQSFRKVKDLLQDIDRMRSLPPGVEVTQALNMEYQLLAAIADRGFKEIYRKNRLRILRAMDAARQIEAPLKSKPYWEEATTSLEKAENAAAGGKFDQADNLLTNSFAGFRQAILACTAPSNAQAETNRQQLKKSASSLFELMKLSPSDPDVNKAGRDISDRLAFTNSIGMQFAYVPEEKVSFVMGSPAREAGRGNNEVPHKRRIDDGFFLGRYEVTRGQFAAFVQATGYKTFVEKHPHRAKIRRTNEWYNPCRNGPEDGQTELYNWRNPRLEQNDNHPVVLVTREDAISFCQWLSRMENRDYRLPKEMEWEYACRAGTDTAFYFGDVASTQQANYYGKEQYPPGAGPVGVFRKTTMPVGSYPPNRLGLFDMHGNVWEWCQETYREDYSRNPAGNHTVPAKIYVRRGGGWASNPKYCRSAKRATWKNGQDCSCASYGFRVLLEDTGG